MACNLIGVSGVAQVTAESPTGTKTARPPLKVMIAGAPAAGKGTQCQKIVDKVRSQFLEQILLQWA